MTDNTTQSERLLEYVKARGAVRSRDVAHAGFTRTLLYSLRDRGQLIKAGRGLFVHPGADISERHTFVEAAKLVPDGVICLLSALVFHQIGTQNPPAVWMALARGSQRPSVQAPRIRFVWFSGRAMRAGLEEHNIEHVRVRVYNVPKTIADLFKYRKKIGVDVAVEALHDGWERRRFTIDELLRHAEVCRVSNVIRPYLEALTR
jgi:predicted transcriptional regulator of viral defense system